MSIARSVLTAIAALSLLAARLEAQGYRIRLDARGQSASYRGLQSDSIPLSQVVQGPTGGPQTPDGYAVECSAADYCFYYRPGATLRGIPLSTTADLLLWGFGVKGLSLHASGRLITDAGDDNAWPATEPTAQLLEGYLEYERDWLKVRGGRLLLASRLQPMGFDGGWARGRWGGPSLEFTAYGGWGLGQAAVVPITSPVLNPLDEWRPVQRQLVAGGEVAWMPGPVDVRAEYRREVDPDLNYFVSERASLSFSTQPYRFLRATGGADWNIDYGELGSADLTLSYLGKRFTVSAGGRRYKPYFSLWTLWGAFSPVPYNAVNASAQVNPISWLTLRARGERYWYEAAEANAPLVTVEDRGYRASFGGTIVPTARWTIDGSYLLEFGPGSSGRYFDVGVTWQPVTTVQLGASGGRVYRPLELRYYDATGTWVGGRAAWSFANQMSIWGDGQYFKDTRDKPDAGANNWDQVRIRAGVTITFGSNVDRRAPLPPARRSLP
jgi:hypothetical protein